MQIITDKMLLNIDKLGTQMAFYLNVKKWQSVAELDLPDHKYFLHIYIYVHVNYGLCDPNVIFGFMHALLQKIALHIFDVEILLCGFGPK